jgi:hypothetical protein
MLTGKLSCAGSKKLGLLRKDYWRMIYQKLLMNLRSWLEALLIAALFG